MYYEKIKVSDLNTMTVAGITPNYTVEYYDFEIDETTNEQIHYAYGVNIIKTSEQVLQEWQEQQNTEIINTPTIEERIATVETTVDDLLTNILPTLM